MSWRTEAQGSSCVLYAEVHACVEMERAAGSSSLLLCFSQLTAMNGDARKTKRDSAAVKKKKKRRQGVRFRDEISSAGAQIGGDVVLKTNYM